MPEKFLPASLAWNANFSIEYEKHGQRCLSPADVPVEPYKIHIYGPFGHFRSHRDTPEEGLVGTLLVWAIRPRGTKRASSVLAIRGYLPMLVTGWRSIRTCLTLFQGWSAARLAFKIFRQGSPKEHKVATRELELQRRLEAIINNSPLPYGMLLDHKYHIGVQAPNGLDSIMLSAAKQRRSVNHLVPVIIETASEVYHAGNEDGDSGDFYRAEVRPIMPAHVAS
jgi:hypothetical protein